MRTIKTRRRAAQVWALLSTLVIVTPATVAIAPSASASITTATSATEVFIGFGDSVAAGYQAGPLASTPYAEACARTTVGYPDLIGATLGYSTYNLACSGATAAAGLNGPQTTASGVVPAQLEQASSLPRAKLATVTIGANDVRWSYWLSQCIYANCATTANTSAFRGLLAIANVGILDALYQMVGPLGVHQVLLTGYYDPMGALAGPVFGLTPVEITWYRARLADVNNVLRSDATLLAHVQYAAVALDDPINDVQLSGAGIFHPTLQGQQKLATQVLA